MARSDLSPSGDPSRFASTVWSELRLAAGKDAGAQAALYRKYRRPVLKFLERRVPRGVDAELLADEVLQSMLDPAFLGQADAAKGRFRDLLLAMTRHAMFNAGRKERAEKRGGGRGRVSLDDLTTDPPADEEERGDFDRLFAKEVMAHARERLEGEAATRKSPEAEVLRLFYDGGKSQKEIAEATALSEAAVNTHLDRARKRLGRHIRDVLSPLVATRQELEEEIKHLLGVLSRRGRRPAR
ncbi:MAG: sigma-70 family RNA polymerase sigma factor [Planctomycetota bacterium]